MTLVKRENLYRYLVMIVHPDRNPNDPLATRKTQDVNFNKNNPDVLIALAKAWNLPIAIEGESPYTSTPDPRRNTNTGNPFQGRSNTGRSNFDNFRDLFNQSVKRNSTNTFRPKVKDIIHIRSLGKCYILGIEPITTGKFNGGIKYHMYSTLKNSFYTYKTTAGSVSGVEKSIGTIDDTMFKELSERFLNTFGRRLNKNNVHPSDIREQFRKAGLEPNKNYGGLKKVRLVGITGVYDVERTTEKCVYIKYYGRSVRKSVDKVQHV